MITTEIEKKLFELFTKHKCQDLQLFGDLNTYIEKLVKDTVGEKDAECYDILRQLSNLENNTGWDQEQQVLLVLTLIESLSVLKWIKVILILLSSESNSIDSNHVCGYIPEGYKLA